MGRTPYINILSHGTTSSSTTLHMDTCSWKLTGEANSTAPHVDVLWLTGKVMKHTFLDRIPSTTPGTEPPRDARDSGSARSHSTHLETSSSDRP